MLVNNTAIDDKTVVITLDLETNGLNREYEKDNKETPKKGSGEPFQIGAAVSDNKGVIYDAFVGKCPIQGEVNPFVKEYVLPQMKDIPDNYDNYQQMLKAFVEFIKKYLGKDKKVVFIEHIGSPVESRMWEDVVKYDLLPSWDDKGVCVPMLRKDISNSEEIGDSVDTYNRYRKDCEAYINACTKYIKGGTHNAMYDAIAALAAALTVYQKGFYLADFDESGNIVVTADVSKLKDAF